MVSSTLKLLFVLGTLTSVNARWFSSLFGSDDVIDRVPKPRTRDPEKLKTQIEVLTQEQESYERGTPQYEEAQVSIDMRKRRIQAVAYLDKGMSESDFDRLVTLQDSLVPLKERLRMKVANPRQGSENVAQTLSDDREHERLKALDSQVKALIRPYASSEPGKRSDVHDDQSRRLGMTQAQRKRAKELREKIRLHSKNPAKVNTLRRQLSALYDSVRISQRSQKTALSGGHKIKNHTLAKQKHIEVTALREEIDMALKRGRHELAEKYRKKLAATQEFYQKAEDEQRERESKLHREIASLRYLLDKATEDDDEEMVVKYRAELSKFDELY